MNDTEYIWLNDIELKSEKKNCKLSTQNESNKALKKNRKRVLKDILYFQQKMDKNKGIFLFIVTNE